MEKKIGFIGLGNMAKAMIGGILKSKLISENNIIGTARTEESLKRAREEFNIRIEKSNIDLAKEADIIFLAIKPNVYDSVIDQIKDKIKEDAIIVVIAAGKTIGSIEEKFTRPIKVVRTMPNTPALVGEGMTAITFNSNISEDERAYMLKIFSSFGRVEEIDENLYHGFVGISGSSPAYIYMVIEALADGGVLEGLPRKLAYDFAAQAVLGASKMVLETGEHPGKLKDDVSSPGGTTIEAVAELERKGIRDGFISAVRLAANKSREMSK